MGLPMAIARTGCVFLEPADGTLFGISGGRPGGNWRQNATAGLHPGGALQEAAAHHPGYLVATIVNHGLAGALGAWITASVSLRYCALGAGLSFIGMAIWTLIPDKIEEDEAQVA